MSVDTISKKPTLGDSAADRISNLPSDITDNILKLLPVQDAVRMSILSKHWRSQWVSLPDLVFGREFEESLHGDWKAESIIDSLLLHHKGPIVKFSAQGFHVDSLPTIVRWLDFLLNHQLEYLALNCCPLAFRLLPNYVFNFVALKHLQLHSVELKLPPEFQGLPKLVNLVLVFATFEFEVLKTVFSKCPKLEYLYLQYCNESKNWPIDIDAPNLKRFHIMGSFHSIRLGCANLEEVKINKDNIGFSPPRGILGNLELRDWAGNESSLSKALNQVPSLKEAGLDNGYLEFLAIGGVPRKLPYNLNHLTSLEFFEIDLGSEGQLACILCLIRSSPNLQHLDVSFDVYRGQEYTLQYLKVQQTCNIPSLSSLKKVRISSMSDVESELEFVKILLLWGTTLEKLIIETSFKKQPGDETDEQYKRSKSLRECKLLKELSTIPRASSEVVLIFN